MESPCMDQDRSRPSRYPEPVLAAIVRACPAFATSDTNLGIGHRQTRASLNDSADDLPTLAVSSGEGDDAHRCSDDKQSVHTAARYGKGETSHSSRTASIGSIRVARRAGK